MDVVTIPFGYEELPEERRSAVIPICIARCDPNKVEIAWGWFEAVSKVQDPLRQLARNLLSDVWRVSEISEWAVLHNWRLHGAHLGRAPEGRVLVAARWHTYNLRAGDRRARRGRNVPLNDEDAVLDHDDYESRYCYAADFIRLRERLERMGIEDVSATLSMLRDGCSWSEIGQRSGLPWNTAYRRFWRWTRRLMSQR